MTTEKFLPSESALLLIDHQVGTMGWVGSTPYETMKKNAVALARAAKALDIPLVLTSSMEEYAQGRLLEELEQIAPEEYAARTQRQGVVNALDDEGFARAVKATGRRRLIVAGVTNDVCTVYPVLTALDEGYAVEVVADAGGSPTAIADDLALRRMADAGAVVSTTNAVLAELAQNWVGEDGQKVLPIVMELMG